MADEIPQDPTIPQETLPGIATTAVKRPGRPAGSGNAKKPNAEAQHADPDAVQRALHAIFRVAATLAKSDAEFQATEFKSTAQELVNLSRRFPPLGIVLIALSPIIVVGELLEKMKRIKDQRKPKDGRQPGDVVPFGHRQEGAG